MSKIVTFLLFGFLFWIAFDFIFYAGLMINYIKKYNISIYFNEFFIESQFWLLWPVGTLLCGAIFMINNNIFKALFYMLSFVLASSTWISSYGDFIGKTLFAKKSVSYQFKTFTVEDAKLMFSSRGLDYVLLPNKKEVVKYPSLYRR